MSILVVARTRMTGGRVCVGAIDRHSGASLRLLTHDGKNIPGDHRIRPSELWNVQCTPAPRLRPPHTEDVFVTGGRRLERVADMRAAIVDLLDPWECELDEIFDGRLSFRDSGRAFLGPEPPLIQYSTGFWIASQPLRLSRFEEKGRSYWVPDGKRIRNVTYVGMEDPSALIPRDALVRFALARWWAFPRDVGDERCSLMLSGWYP
jgi:hypothetical protein